MLAVPSWTFYQLPTDLTHGCAVPPFLQGAWHSSADVERPREGQSLYLPGGSSQCGERGEHFQKNDMAMDQYL